MTLAVVMSRALDGLEALPRRFTVLPVDVQAVKQFIRTHG